MHLIAFVQSPSSTAEPGPGAGYAEPSCGEPVEPCAVGEGPPEPGIGDFASRPSHSDRPSSPGKLGRQGRRCDRTCSRGARRHHGRERVVRDRIWYAAALDPRARPERLHRGHADRERSELDEFDPGVCEILQARVAGSPLRSPCCSAREARWPPLREGCAGPLCARPQGAPPPSDDRLGRQQRADTTLPVDDPLEHDAAIRS